MTRICATTTVALPSKRGAVSNAPLASHRTSHAPPDCRDHHSIAPSRPSRRCSLPPGVATTALSFRGATVTTIAFSSHSDGSAGAAFSHGASHHITSARARRPSRYGWFGEGFRRKLYRVERSWWAEEDMWPVQRGSMNTIVAQMATSD